VIYAVAKKISQYVARFADDCIWKMISNPMHMVGDLLGIFVCSTSWFRLRYSLDGVPTDES
jgi:hypothetical protein